MYKICRRSSLLIFFMTVIICASLSAETGGTAGAGAASSGQSSKFRADVMGAGLIVPSYNETDSRPLLIAGGFSLGAAVEYYIGNVPLRFQTTYYYTGRSEIDSSTLFLYRGFSGLRQALESGYAFKFSGIELELLAGGAISISEYLNTSLVSAYWSLVAEPRILIPFSENRLAVTLGIPVEYMFRGSTQSLAAGLSAGVSFSL